MSLTQDAIERLLAVKKHILEEPLRFDMEYIRAPRSKAPCGTTCCIAGWLLKLDNPELKADRVFWISPVHGWAMGSDTAAALLGIPYDLVNPLFHADEWPEPLYAAYYNSKTDAERAKAGADAIDAFIAADGDWDA